jgi:thiol:disulfide interchange protein
VRADGRRACRRGRRAARRHDRPAPERPRRRVCAAPGTGFTTARPQAASRRGAPESAGARLRAGGLAAFLAFLGIFGTGLALNLTPCVYPMLG